MARSPLCRASSIGALFAVASFASVLCSGRAQDATAVILPGLDALAAHATFSTQLHVSTSRCWTRQAGTFPTTGAPVVAQLRSITVDSFRLLRRRRGSTIRRWMGCEPRMRGQGWQHMVNRIRTRATDRRGRRWIPSRTCGRRIHADRPLGADEALECGQRGAARRQRAQCESGGRGRNDRALWT